MGEPGCLVTAMFRGKPRVHSRADWMWDKENGFWEEVSTITTTSVQNVGTDDIVVRHSKQTCARASGKRAGEISSWQEYQCLSSTDGVQNVSLQDSW